MNPFTLDFSDYYEDILSAFKVVFGLYSREDAESFKCFPLCCRVNLPFSSVSIPIVVPSKYTETKGKGSPEMESFTMPDTEVTF